jgi:hypothetical protein
MFDEGQYGVRMIKAGAAGYGTLFAAALIRDNGGREDDV